METSRQSRAADTAALCAAAALFAAVMFLGLARFLLMPSRFLLALAITASFALLAWLTRGVNASGALAGAVIAFIMAVRDLRFFWLLLAVFALTHLATRWKRSTKVSSRLAEPANGRTASQVMANLGLAGVLVAFAPAPFHLLALAALVELVADTISSEVGTAYPGRTILITSGKRVAPGTDGGISFTGTLAGCVGALAIAGLAFAVGLTSERQSVVIVSAGILGMFVDSVLGATLERRRWLNNDLVNLLGTASAVGIARLSF
ncbi:MAG TPA: DUF92 domain-containing protein [Alphaproteobacteria bacterium]|nr:DUF92 domain-containing protein [Alphaproteobacteria bacterium]